MKKALYFGTVLAVVLTAIITVPAVFAAPPSQELQLNLSHIECVDGQVEVHFVLLNVPDGITPGTLTYTYGSISPGAHTGNVWHYTDYLSDGTYNITSASVDVNGTMVTLHNPGDYAGTYDCGGDEEPVSHTVTYGQDLSCEGWGAWYKIDNGDKVQYSAGSWSNGAATVSSFNIPTIPGDNYNITQIPGLTLYQPEGCQGEEGENWATLTWDPTCEDGGFIQVEASEGANVPPLPSWQWTDPTRLETFPAGSVTITWASGTPSSVTLEWPDIQETANCNPPKTRGWTGCTVDCGAPQQEPYIEGHVTTYLYNAVKCDDECAYRVAMSGWNVDLILYYNEVPIQEFDPTVKYRVVENPWGTHVIYDFPQKYWGGVVLMTHDENGNLVRFRDVYGWYDENHTAIVMKFVICSLWPGYWNVENGVLQVHNAMNSSDVAYWLLLEGYFDDFTSAHDYVVQYWIDPATNRPYEPLDQVQIPLPAK